VSTDEVYGTLGDDDPAFTEEHAYAPNSPYSASKAASDHIVRAYHHTFGLNVTTSNCSNNYGPYQFPEKLIPLCLSNILADKPLPIYGNGKNIRDWLYVEEKYPDATPAQGRASIDLITYVTDRAGHDWRYAIDAGKSQRELGYTPKETFETGIVKTVDWYLDNPGWWKPLLKS